MGFASGSYAADDIWQAIKKYVARKNHQKVAESIVREFENMDSDDWSYEEGSVYHTARPEDCEEDDT